MSVGGGGGSSIRLSPPLVPAVAPAALLFACSLRASVACQSESHRAWDGDRERVSQQFTGWHVFHSWCFRVCQQPTAKGVAVWGRGLGRTNCLELPLCRLAPG